MIDQACWLPDDTAHCQKVIVSLCEGWVLPPLSFGHLPQMTNTFGGDCALGVFCPIGFVACIQSLEQIASPFGPTGCFATRRVLREGWRGWVLNFVRSSPLDGGMWMSTAELVERIRGQQEESKVNQRWQKHRVRGKINKIQGALLIEMATIWHKSIWN